MPRITCLKDVVDLAFGGIRKHTPQVAPWEDIVDQTENSARMAASGVKAVKQFVSFLRPPDRFYKSEPGKALNGLLQQAETNFRLKTNQELERVAPAFKTTDPEGLINKGFLKSTRTKLYSPTADKRHHDIMTGKIKASQMTPDEIQTAAPVKNLVISHMLKAPEDFGFPKGTTKIDFDSDVMSATIGAFKNKAVNFDSYSLVPRALHAKVFHGKNPDSVGFAEWFSALHPQLVRKTEYAFALQEAPELISKLPTHEKIYTRALMNRVTGKSQGLVDVVDAMLVSAGDEMGVKDLDARPATRFTLGLTRAAYRGAIWGNPQLALVNLSQSINTAAQAGPLLTAKGLSNFATGPGRKLIRDVETALFGEMHQFYRRNKGLLGSLDHYGYWMFQKAEYLNRGLAFHTGLSDYMVRHKIDNLSSFLALRGGSAAEKDIFRKGLKEAVQTSAETQFVYSAISSSPYLSSPIGRLVGGQFMSYSINQSEFLARAVMRGDWAFLARWLSLTGLAGTAAYMGYNGSLFHVPGLATGKDVGGAGALPFAWDLWESGKRQEAILTAGEGLFAHIPDSFRITQGLTPANSAVLGALKFMGALHHGSEKEIIDASTNFTRKTLAFMPGFLSLKRISEAGMAAMSEGVRNYPGSEGAGILGSMGEATAIAPTVNRIGELYFGGKIIPGIDSAYTGPLAAKDERIEETIAQGMGFRTRKQEMDSRELQTRRTERLELEGQRAGVSDVLARSLETGDTETFNRTLNQALQQGLYIDAESLKKSLGAAVEARTLTSKERSYKRLPKILKLRELQKKMEEGPEGE